VAKSVSCFKFLSRIILPSLYTKKREAFWPKSNRELRPGSKSARIRTRSPNDTELKPRERRKKNASAEAKLGATIYTKKDNRVEIRENQGIYAKEHPTRRHELAQKTAFFPIQPELYCDCTTCCFSREVLRATTQ
jgi:hypothetical protein